MGALFSRPQPDWTDVASVADYMAEGARILGDARLLTLENASTVVPTADIPEVAAAMAAL